MSVNGKIRARVGRLQTLLLLIALIMAVGCASRVTVSSNIRRSLPLILDESSTGGRRFEAGLAYRTGSDKGERHADFYQEAVNSTFEAYDRSNAMAYLRFSPRQMVTARFGVDDVGYTGDLAVRTNPAALIGYLSPGLTVADKASVNGYTSARPVYLRIAAGGSVAPFALDRDSATAAAARFRIYGGIAWAQYPVWIDFTQTYHDAAYLVAGTWQLKRMEKGEARIASLGAAYEGRRWVCSCGLQYPLGMAEQAVRIDLGSQPPYLITTNPVPSAEVILRLGVRF